LKNGGRASSLFQRGSVITRTFLSRRLISTAANYGSTTARDSAQRREFLKTRYSDIDSSEMTAVAVATSFPIAFQSAEVRSEHNAGYIAHLDDAGLIDNLAMIPSLELLRARSPGNFSHVTGRATVSV
jgi:hypothetical protein